MLQKGKQPLISGRWLKGLYRWGVYACSKKIKLVPVQLEALSESLYHSSRDVEDNFLQVGQMLQSIYGDSVKLTQTIQDIVSNMTDDSEENMLKKVANVIRDVKVVVSRHHTHVKTNLDQVRSVIDQLSELFNCCHTLERIAMNLRVVGLNIGVESTRSPQARDMFTVVSEEIIHLSEKVAKLGARIREDVEFSQNEQLSAYDAISNGLQSLKILSHNASKAVNTSMGEIENCISSSMRIFEQTGDRFNAVSNQVSELVAGMQFHDNMRQRLEHISKALSDTVGINGNQDKGRKRFSVDGEALHALQSVIPIQQLQLSAVISEIDSVYSQVVSSFETIDDEIKSLVHSLSGIEDDYPTSNDGNAVDIEEASVELAKALSDLNHLLVEGGELTQKIDDSVVLAGKIGERFTEHLKEVLAISFETQIKALNAIVKAGHLDDQGRTLEVLAQEMNNLSKLTGTFVSTVENNLDKMSHFAQKLHHKIEDDEDNQSFNNAALSKLSESLTKGIDQMSSLQIQYRDHTKTASDLSEGLGRKIQQTLNELCFLPGFADTMSMHLSDLDAIERILKLFTFNQNSIASDTEQIADTYTMERERDIHEEAMNEVKSVGEAAGEIYQFSAKKQEIKPQMVQPEEEKEHKVLAKEDEDEFGENVELF